MSLKRQLNCTNIDNNNNNNSSNNNNNNDSNNNNELFSFRLLKDLYIHSETLKCALGQSNKFNRCIPCMYKISPNGLFSHDYNIPSNQRPEQCPRSKHKVYNGIYTNQQKLLLVGDGDFSFSQSIVSGTNNGKEIYCTSYETLDTVISTYPTSKLNIDKLIELGAHVLFEVDATNLSKTNIINDERKGYFDRIIWQFPCIPENKGADGQVNELANNQELLRNFFISAPIFLNNNGEIHITHKTLEPFSWWKIIDIGIECGLKYKGSIIFDRYLYPGYTNRKALDNKGFPLHDAQVYIFSNSNNRSNSTFIMNNNILSMESEAVQSDIIRLFSIYKNKNDKSKKKKVT